MIILGIDPGTAKMGFGIVNKIQNPAPTIGTGRGLKSKRNSSERQDSKRIGTRNPKIKCLGYGLIQTDSSLPAPERLKKINNKLNKLIREYKPDILAVENVYFFKNLKTAMPVSQAKGVVLFTAAKKKIPVYEFTPLQIKMAITGYGRAGKKQVQKMIKPLLNLNEVPRSDDAADALATAICCALIIK